MKTCFCCSALIGPLTQYQIGMHWGDNRLERDEVTVTEAATIEKVCHACWQQISQNGRYQTRRDNIEMMFTLIENRTAAGVRHDKTISAWATRKEVPWESTTSTG